MDAFFKTQPIYRDSLFPNIIFHRSFSNGYRNINTTITSAKIASRIIIGLNFAVFGGWTFANLPPTRPQLQQWMMDNFTLSAANWRAGRYYTLLTSAFSHQNPFHFLFNMMTFTAFSNILIWSGMRGMHIFSLCIGSAITASFAWMYQRGIAANQAQREKFPNAIVRSRESALGASGMVMGAGMVATCLMPMAPAGLFFIPVHVPLWTLTALYFGIDAYYLHSETSMIGHSAHLGGAIYGAVYYLAYLRNYGGVWQMLRRALRR